MILNDKKKLYTNRLILKEKYLKWNSDNNTKMF